MCMKNATCQRYILISLNTIIIRKLLIKYLYHHCKFIPTMIYIVCASSIWSLYICYVASTQKFVKTFGHLLVNKLI